ncbi:MAG TPA: zinc ribbon domain-containing protein [Blastocatellia bacterium]|nr:zinc ribbon domain-containing protein [Blastocatellia bacterium]
MTVVKCEHCEAQIAPEDTFCRYCGAKLGSGNREASLEREDSRPELDDSWIASMEEVEAIANIAIPDNFKEVTVEHLKSRVIQAIWIISVGIDPYAALGIRDVEAQDDLERKMANNSSSGDWLWPAAGPSPVTERYHLIWSGGLISHSTLTREQAGRVESIMARVGYRIEACDCDKTKYKASETNSGFLNKA